MIKLISEIMTISKSLSIDLLEKKGHSGVNYTMKTIPTIQATVIP